MYYSIPAINDVFRFLPENYRTPIDQAKTRLACELRREIRTDMRCEARWNGHASADWSLATDGDAVMVSGSNHWGGRYAVVEIGDDDVFTANRARELASAEIQCLYEIMRAALVAGNPSVRHSKRSGAVVFSGAVKFPRWRANGEWWPSESTHLCYTDAQFAREQLTVAGLL